MSIRPCDLTNEQWAALRRESEQKAAPEAKKEPEANDGELGPITHYRNGVPVRAGNTQTPFVREIFDEKELRAMNAEQIKKEVLSGQPRNSLEQQRAAR